MFFYCKLTGSEADASRMQAFEEGENLVIDKLDDSVRLQEVGELSEFDGYGIRILIVSVADWTDPV